MIHFWHQLKVEEIINLLKTDPEKGLTFDEVISRREKYGLNVLPEEKEKNAFLIFLSQFLNPLVYLLLIAGILAFIFHDYLEGGFIFVAVLINSVFGFFQENKAKNILKKLKKEIVHYATVLRDGNLKEVPQKDLVKGDIVILKAGDKVPADCRVIDAQEAKVNEMILTGEWVPTEKQNTILKRETPLAERKNMIFLGTEVVKGKIKAIVVEIGVDTELGKLGKALIEIKEEKTPLQRRVIHFSKILLVIICVLSILIFIDGIIRGFNLLDLLITIIAVMVASVPEGLPIVLAISLALGMQRILKSGGLIKNLSSVETLGSASIIAMDKTGTLTKGEMKVKEILGDKRILEVALLNSQAYLENPESLRINWQIKGEPEEKAILEKVLEFYPYQEILKKKKNILISFPFDSKMKYSSCLFLKDFSYFIGVIGAPEVLLDLSLEGDRSKWRNIFNEKTEEGNRIIGCAIKKLASREIELNKEFIGKGIFPHHLLKDLQFLGLIIIEDPIREEAKEAIQESLNAGIQPIIISGDHKTTVKRIAKEVGLVFDQDEVFEGKEIDKISDFELEKRIEDFKIIARAEPLHKLKIIQAWQKKNKIVAMTGDGVNDTLALKKADIGIALHSGTEVAKAASDLILLNDSFKVIVMAIEEGRRILNNIRKIITYLLSDSFTEIILIGLSIFFRWPLPVRAVQILWVNIIEDTFPNIALAFEPQEKEVLKEKPETFRASFFTREMKFLIFIIGLITDLLLLGLFYFLMYFSSYNLAHIRTIIFACLAIDSLFLVFSLKSLKKNIWKINIFSNKYLNYSVVFGFSLLFLAIYFPFFQKLLKTFPLNIVDWFLVFSLGAFNVLLIEFGKWLFISKKIKE